MKYNVVDKIPTPEEYCQLRIDAGLSPKSLDAAATGLPNSLYAVCVFDGPSLIAMGRVVGDGACFFQIVDIAVNPSYQGFGLGKLVMDKVETYLKSVAQSGSYVSLIADKPAFYEKLNYLHTAPEAYGMYKRLA